MSPSFTRVSRSALQMNVPGGQLTSPGKNLKPMFDGTFKEAGAHLEKYVLEHENGSRAIVDTKTATCISWKNAKGVEMIAAPTNVHRFPSTSATLNGEFVPEERAKKVSFDRMIFKAIAEDNKDIEYRVDVTMRENSLEYDVVIKNAGATAHNVDIGLVFNLNGAKVTGKKGYKTGDDKSVSTGTWSVPVGKFKETEFYVKIEPN